MKLKWQLLTGFLLLALLGTIAGAVGLLGTRQVAADFATLTSARPTALRILGHLQATSLQMTQAALNAMLAIATSPDSSSTSASPLAGNNQAFTAAWQEIQQGLAELDSLASTTSFHRHIQQEIRTQLEQLHRASQRLIQAAADLAVENSGKTGPNDQTTLRTPQQALEQASKLTVATIAAALIHARQEFERQHAHVSQQVDQTVLLNSGIFLLIISCVVLFGGLFSRAIAKPVTRLKEAAVAIGQGQFQTRVEIPSQGEIGELTVAFNRMAAELEQAHDVRQHTHDKLEMRVQERTAALEELNIFLQKEVFARKRVEKELRASKERLRTVVTSAPIVLWAIDTHGVFTFSEGQGLETLQLRSGELVGQSVFSVYATVPEIAAYAKRALAGEAFTTMLEIEEIVFETRYAPLRNERGDITGAIGVGTNITERCRMEREREELTKQLVDTSRQAGMAEVSTHILHNVGNVLNSVNVSTGVLASTIRQLPVNDLCQMSTLLQQHRGNQNDLGQYLSTDPKGQRIPSYLAKLGKHLTTEQAVLLEELGSLTKNIEHIKHNIQLQQDTAKRSQVGGIGGVEEPTLLTEVMEQAIAIRLADFEQHDIQIIRDYTQLPPIITDRHQILQILVNLISNAKYAIQDKQDKQNTCAQQNQPTSPQSPSVLTLQVGWAGNEQNTVRLQVSDTGVGVKPEHLPRIFTQGFTTRPNGHGFGLHSGALSAKNLGGSLSVHSPGEDQGATFRLDLPFRPLTHTSQQSYMEQCAA